MIKTGIRDYTTGQGKNLPRNKKRRCGKMKIAKIKKAIEERPLFWNDSACNYWTFDFLLGGKWVECIEFGDGGTVESCIYNGLKIVF